MKRFSVEQIIVASEAINTPFLLDLDNQQHWQIEQVLRIMPGKRAVLRARDESNNIQLLKVFLRTSNFQREIAGYQQLKKTGVNTPRLLSQQAFTEGGLCCYEFIENTQSFAACWQVADEITKTKLLEDLLAIVQRLYDGGICQADLHLGNFIFSSETLFALDPASCESLHDQAMKRDNLALLLAQFHVSDWPKTSAAIASRFGEIDPAALQERAVRRFKKRTQDFLQKIYRECTQIRTWCVPTKNRQRVDIYCERERWSSTLQALLENLGDTRRDVACNVSTKPVTSGEMLKHGNSSIVSSIVIDGKKVVVKNSRNKNIWRLLRRCLRRSRASNAWYFSHLLQMAGVYVPAPIALVERKLGPFVLESWFVSDFIEGDSLLDVWTSRAPSARELSSMSGFFAAMRQLGISHGDMKATNLLVKDEKIFVIDYDGMSQHGFAMAAQRARQKDQQRFFQNWPQLKLDKLL